MIIAEVLFWLSVLAISHSYIIYPLILQVLANKKDNNINVYNQKDTLPTISIIMSLFNEEEVISEKIESIISTNYPINKIEIIIGSDCSTDNTNNLVEKSQNKHSETIKFYDFKKRQGKANIINQLYDESKGQIIILSDANVMFDKDTIFELVKHFKNKAIGLVDSHMINKGIQKEGISIQESAYISREVQMKNHESKIWGTMMGPFGGCFAIRRDLYSYVPDNYLVDDFYINMKIFEQGKKAINDLTAIVYEDVSNNLLDEFRRKVRIATGNFQNLSHFKFALLNLQKSDKTQKRIKGLSFSYLSHKVIRWIGPIFLLIAYISNIILALNRDIYIYTLILYSLSFFIPLLDLILRQKNINIIILRFITHFYSMNLALLIGFIKYLKGVKSSVWQPTKRNQ